MPLAITQVDAFTDEPFSGNPAAVCVLDEPADERWMQAVAAEMNLAETAFAVRPGATGGPYGLRWFTPTKEVPLCGHATLATAHVLFTTGEVTGDRVRFATASGELGTDRLRDGRLELDLPADPPAAASDPVPEPLLPSLGLDVAAVEAVLVTPTKWFVVVTDRAEVGPLTPDFRRLATIEGFGTIVTAAGDGRPYDCVSRVFAPGAGIDEDPVTGAAHCVVGPYWAARLGRDVLTARQASSRGGQLGLTVRDDRIGIAGHAVTVLRGELLV
jgi:PhzF family phenazine biosynthesis protein